MSEITHEDTAFQRRSGAVLTQWRAAGLLALGAAFLFIVCPLGVGADYPNHLARAYIDLTIGESEALRRFYEIDYRFVPDFTIEMIVPRLAPFVGIYGAGAIVVALAVVAAPLAGIAISRSLHESGAGWLPLIGFATLFNRNLEFGFVNFLFGLGLALFAFALWVRTRPGWRRTIIIAPAGAVIAANHILAFLFLGYIALLWEAAHFSTGKRGGAKDFAGSLLVWDALAFLPGLALIAYGFLIAEDVSTYGGGVAVFGQRMAALTSGFGFYNAPLSVLAGASAFAAGAGGLYLGLRSGVVVMSREMAIVCLGVLALVVFMPTHVAGIWGLHLRYGGALVILVGAGLRFPDDRPTPRWPAAGFAAVLALLAANGVLNVLRVNAVQSEIRAGLSALPTGARVLPATDREVGFEIGAHAAAFAVLEADAYAPNLFTNISAVSVRPEFRAMHLPQGKPLLPETLNAVRDRPLPPAANGRWSETFYYDWPRRYTHVLFVRSSPDREIGLDGLEEIAGGDSFALFAVKH